MFSTQLALAVDVSLGKREVTKTADGERVEQPVTIANTINSYTLSWDAATTNDDPNTIVGGQWGWQQEYIPLGMTAPSRPNWYYQAFFNWTFDDESLHLRPAEMRVVRGYGEDAMIEYVWDTPVVRAWIRFAMVEGSDKLLMFGGYEPKQEIATSSLRFICYPSFFPEPRERSVTTALGTRRPGDSIDLDLERERWVLYEDTSEGRPGGGSAGMIIGTPDAFSSIHIPVGAYGITTTLTLEEGRTDFALALYDFPMMPDYQVTRDFFGAMGDSEAEAIEVMAAGDLDQPLGEIPVDEERMTSLLEAGAKLFDRPAETWRSNPEPLDFPWASKIAGEPIRTVVFCPRWTAWEAMELARRVELDVRHIYFDTKDELSYPRAWPYSATTGVGAIPFGVASVQANALVADKQGELMIAAGLRTKAIPGVTRIAMTQQVEKGKGLLLTGSAGVLTDWPEELFATPDPGLSEAIMAGIDWRAIPGLGDGEPGRVNEGPPIRAWRYGQGRVVMLAVNLNQFGCFSPRNGESEGIMGALDRTLALAARAAMYAAGREPACEIDLDVDHLANGRMPYELIPAPAAGAVLRWRVQDELERVVGVGEVADPGGIGAMELPTVPPSRRCYLDAMVVDGDGNCLGLATAGLPSAEGPRLTEVALSPSELTHELAPPWVKLPDGGALECSATVADAAGLQGATAVWEISDVFGRVLARTTTQVSGGGGPMTATLKIGAPVTPDHMLDVTLRLADQTLDSARLRFTNPPPYPYDDFTGLMWSTCGGSPSLRVTDRLCYDWGAEMADPANTVNADDARCARDFALTSRSGLRVIPYATRVFSETDESNQRGTCLHDPNYLAAQRNYLTANARQCAPYGPPAYTLGDENAISRAGGGEPCHRPASVEAFREWLRGKYGEIATLNATWATRYADFDEIAPMLIADAAALEVSYAAWFDHKIFMDQAFADTHDWMREVIREQDPGARVGWDGLLGYHWKAGYDFDLLTRNCDLNQVYVGQWIQGELVRSFAGPDALVGKWGNRVADNEAGWTAYPWHALFDGCNSAWWWTSWGVEYVPFNPDMSRSNYAKWFFPALNDVASGPGKLILHAERDDSGVAILYSQRDLFAAALAGKLVTDCSFASDRGLLRAHEAMLKGVNDLGSQFVYITEADLAGGRVSADRYRMLILSLASSLSDEEVAAVRGFVEAGGTLLVDGRAGYLDGDGVIRDTRALDEVLGVTGVAGTEGFAQSSVRGELDGVEVEVFEPRLRLTTGEAVAEVGGAPVIISNHFGEGRAITLNISLVPLLTSRDDEGPNPLLDIIGAALTTAGVEPPCEVTREDGSRPLCVAQMLYADGAARYLCIEQDLLLPGLADQPGHVKLPEPAIVYDVRAGKRVGEGQVSEWDVTFARGDPHVYALLPYEVTGVALDAPAQVTAGETATVKTAVQTGDAAAGYHVVRLDVYAPGSDAPHRQYSRNLGCEDGVGETSIPFALSDAKGAWRLVARDVATGVRTERALTVK
jgi:hypothetical protein